MRGEIVQYDPETGAGLVSGDDLARYGFSSRSQGLAVGRRVDFVVASDGAATDLIVLQDARPQPVVIAPEPDLGLWGYFRRCVTTKYVDGNGRARRKEYWSFALFHTLILFLLFTPVLVLVIIDAETGRDMAAFGMAGIAFVGLIMAGLILPGVTVLIRRFHDVGLSGWLVLIGCVPYAGGLFLFVVCLLPSQPAVNLYGAPPTGTGQIAI